MGDAWTSDAARARRRPPGSTLVPPSLLQVISCPDAPDRIAFLGPVLERLGKNVRMRNDQASVRPRPQHRMGE